MRISFPRSKVPPKLMARDTATRKSRVFFSIKFVFPLIASFSLTILFFANRYVSSTVTASEDQLLFIALDQFRNHSSVDYMACCGAGHRMSKLSDASYVAQTFGFSLRSFWGYCDTTEVYSYLFGPQPATELRDIDSSTTNVTMMRGQYIRINNDVPGFKKIYRGGEGTLCPCDFSKMEHDTTFYTRHRDRFRAKRKVDAYRERHFLTNRTIVGIHIRAGNGESGDFSDRGRAIGDMDRWLQNLARLLLRQQSDWGPTLSIFLATDTASTQSRLKELVGHQVPLVYLNQIHPDTGSGVLFGERGSVLTSGVKCKRGWEATLMDMMLLSHADVVVSARPSSFTQSLPMSLVLSRSKTKRKVAKPYCEVNPTATEMVCYEDVRTLLTNNQLESLHLIPSAIFKFQEFCCQGLSNFSLGGIKQKYEYIRMPESIPLDTNKYKIRERPSNGCIPKPEGWKQVCLPYDFAEHRVSPRKRRKQET